MDDSKTPELTVDCEFRDLIRPLLKDEYRHLEAALLAEGCREPITVWKGIIVDGHNRYELCRRLGIPFEVRERHFDNREEAIIWICANQQGRRNISEQASPSFGRPMPWERACTQALFHDTGKKCFSSVRKNQERKSRKKMDCSPSNRHENKSLS